MPGSDLKAQSQRTQRNPLSVSLQWGLNKQDVLRAAQSLPSKTGGRDAGLDRTASELGWWRVCLIVPERNKRQDKSRHSESSDSLSDGS